MKAGGPYEVKVLGPDGSTVKFEDVLIGEVWMCSGQSNMEMPVMGGRQFWNVLNCEQEVKDAWLNEPFLRLRRFLIEQGLWDDAQIPPPQREAPGSHTGMESRLSRTTGWSAA